VSDKKTDRVDEIPPHRLLREVLRHYLEYEHLVASTDGRMANISHGYWVKGDDGTKLRKVAVSLSFWDLQGALKELSPRKKEAIFYNVIYDKKQADVAAIMKITTVSVGQYVEQGVIQIAKKILPDEYAAWETNMGIEKDHESALAQDEETEHVGV
jgi:DNA-directed RNA polymerase specialized sigma24 family protein